MSTTGYSSLAPYIGGDGENSGSLPSFKSRTQAIVEMRRPWRDLLARPSSYSLPNSFGEFTSRLRNNLAHFRVNYAMIVLFILFLSLLFHPIPMVVFIVIFIFWFLLYFFSDEPVVVFDRTVDDRVILIALGITTIVSLALTGVWLNVLVALTIGGAAMVVHATFRETDDLFLDEDEMASGSLSSFVGTSF